MNRNSRAPPAGESRFMPSYVLSTTAHQPVAGEVVVTVLLELIERYGRARIHAERYRQRLHIAPHRRATRSNTQCSASVSRTGPPAIPRRREGSSGSTRPSSAGFTPGPQHANPAEPQRQLDEFREHYTSSAPTARLTATHQDRPTARTRPLAELPKTRPMTRLIRDTRRETSQRCRLIRDTRPETSQRCRRWGSNPRPSD
jgi:hypothetical protein